jgi:hypothetical protein
MALTLNTVNDLLTSSQSMVDEMTNIKENIQQNYNTLEIGISGNTKIKSEIRDLKEEQQKYDTLFEEEESIIQSMGGKTRMQTLQEFILTFFYSSMIIFSVALGIYYYLRTGSSKEMYKVFGFMAFIILVITGFLVRYA